MNEMRAQAQKIKDLLLEIAPVIEEYTAKVCPGCRDVCCRQKRCIPEPFDVRYREALGASLPETDRARPADGPCQFLGAGGCVIPRWVRPWRCTWYFCDPLLDALRRGPQKNVRMMSALVQQIVDIRSSW